MRTRIYPQRFLDIDVLTAARQRFATILERFDDAFVSFSGGKDSLVCLHLLKEVWDQAGRSGLIKAAFWDEEILPDAVIDFVEEFRHKDWVQLFWYCFPLESNKFVLGQVTRCIQWDPDRPHMRAMPEWAIKPAPGRKGPFSQYDMGREVMRHCRGRVANITGIRAVESPNRYAMNAGKLVDNWIHGQDHPGCTHVTPIYDWTENDVMKYLGERGIRYCSLYDAQLWSGTPLRVATPIHTAQAKRIDRWRRVDPEFYGRVTAIFPEMLMQERYWGQLDEYHEYTLEALEKWIGNHVSNEMRSKAATMLRLVQSEFYHGTLGDQDWPVIWRVFTNGEWVKGLNKIKIKKIYV